MKTFTEYITEATDIEDGDIMKCNVCGRELKILKKGKGSTLICCMKEMVKK